MKKQEINKNTNFTNFVMNEKVFFSFLLLFLNGENSFFFSFYLNLYLKDILPFILFRLRFKFSRINLFQQFQFD